MLAGHMDEIGFMVNTSATTASSNSCPGRLVRPGAARAEGHHPDRQGEVIGVIGARPPHLLSPEERKKVVERKICT